MAKRLLKEILILRQEGRPAMAVKQSDNILIFNARMRDLPSNLPKGNAPIPKHGTLVFWKILRPGGSSCGKSAERGGLRA
jgi:hypothetical protein